MYRFMSPGPHARPHATASKITRRMPCCAIVDESVSPSCDNRRASSTSSPVASFCPPAAKPQRTVPGFGAITNASPTSHPNPARPARPTICRKSFDFSKSCNAGFRRKWYGLVTTTRFAGRFTPVAIVLVQHTTLNSPLLNPCSTKPFSSGRNAAWCHTTPRDAHRANVSFCFDDSVSVAVCVFCFFGSSRVSASTRACLLDCFC
mmetsp:Transcript_5576/g.21101  ORF Transcript_5576/g.21101 Transcript_5576/m.21101 type:complete len:205 (+) Transcript_5576:3743-4357(+)